jgi:hypothetical protein
MIAEQARTPFTRIREITSDVLIATAVIWALPLLLGLIVALATLLRNAM